MDENELNRRLKSVPNYLGSYAVDELDEIKVSTLPFFITINLDTRIGGGTHWIALGIYENEVYVCDPLGGLLPGKIKPQRLLDFLHLFTTNRKLFLTKQLQHSSSGTCALYCITFILQMSENNCLGDFLRMFTSDLRKNDRTIKFLNKIDRI